MYHYSYLAVGVCLTVLLLIDDMTIIPKPRILAALIVIRHGSPWPSIIDDPKTDISSGTVNSALAFFKHVIIDSDAKNPTPKTAACGTKKPIVSPQCSVSIDPVRPEIAAYIRPAMQSE